MNKHWLHNFIAVCVVILFLAILLLETGCSDIHVIKTGDDWDISYKNLWREVEKVEVIKTDDKTIFRLGKAGSDDPIEGIVPYLKPPGPGATAKDWEDYNRWVDERANN